MAKSISIKKAQRRNAVKRALNKARRTRLKNALKKFYAAENKAELLKEVQSIVDKSAKHRIIHKNKASRIKSRLFRLVNQPSA